MSTLMTSRVQYCARKNFDLGRRLLPYRLCVPIN
jgi:hypothetical protein